MRLQLYHKTHHNTLFFKGFNDFIICPDSSFFIEKNFIQKSIHVFKKHPNRLGYGLCCYFHFKTSGNLEYVKYCTDGSLYDVHHIISAEALSATGLLSYNTAPCIRMLKSDHLDTKSYGRYKSSADYRKKQIELIQQGRIKDVIIEEINTIRSLFGSRYDREIKEMLKFVNKLEDNNWEV